MEVFPASPCQTSPDAPERSPLLALASPPSKRWAWGHLFAAAVQPISGGRGGGVAGESPIAFLPPLPDVYILS